LLGLAGNVLYYDLDFLVSVVAGDHRTYHIED
jgi:hypothetical protein